MEDGGRGGQSLILDARHASVWRVGRDVSDQCGALRAPPRGDALITAGTWTRDGAGRERQSGAVWVSCEELTSRDGAGGTPAPRMGEGRARVDACWPLVTVRAGRPHRGRDTGARVDACWPLETARAESPHHGWERGAREWTLAGLLRRRGRKARTTAGRHGRA